MNLSWASCLAHLWDSIIAEFLVCLSTFSCENFSNLLAGLCNIKVMFEMFVLLVLSPPGLVESCCVAGQKWEEENQHCNHMPVETEDLNSVCG